MPSADSQAAAFRLIELVALLLPIVALLIQVTVRYYFDPEVELPSIGQNTVLLAGFLTVVILITAASLPATYLLTQGYDDLIDLALWIILFAIALIGIMAAVLIASTFLHSWSKGDTTEQEGSE